MRKAFIALGVVIAALLIAFITFNQQPKYADVSMPKLIIPIYKNRVPI